MHKFPENIFNSKNPLINQSFIKLPKSTRHRIHLQGICSVSSSILLFFLAQRQSVQRSVRLLVVAAEHLMVTLNQILLRRQSGLVLVVGSTDNSNHSNLAAAEGSSAFVQVDLQQPGLTIWSVILTFTVEMMVSFGWMWFSVSVRSMVSTWQHF